MAAPQNGELYPRQVGEVAQYYIESAVRSAPKHTGFVPNLADDETKDTQAFKYLKKYLYLICPSSKITSERTLQTHSAPFKSKTILHTIIPLLP